MYSNNTGEKLDLCDSIIENIAWDKNMLDIIITINYYLGKNDDKIIKIKFLNCSRFIYQINSIGLCSNTHIWECITIVQWKVNENNGELEVSFEGDRNYRFLTINCRDFIIEE